MEYAPLRQMARHIDPARRPSLTQAMAWVDQQRVAAPEIETVPIAQAHGRILACAIKADLDNPPNARAAIAGVAVQAQAVLGAHSYQPIALRLSRGAVDGVTGVRVEAGEPLPDGADAIVARDACAFPAEDFCEIYAPVPPGHAVEPAGSHFSRGTLLLSAGRCLEPRDLALLVAAGMSQAPVVRRPRVDLILEGPEDSLAVASLLLRSLIERDGGLVSKPAKAGLKAHEPDISPPDIILIVGQAEKLDDPAVKRITEWGAVAILGVAQVPGEATAIGVTRQATPVFVLPAAPAGCLWAYEWLAGRALRRLAGGDPDPPLRATMMRLRGKIVSRIGVSQVFPVRRLGKGIVEPGEALEDTDLFSTVKADGFVITGEGSEGYGDGSEVLVHLQHAGNEPRDVETRLSDAGPLS
jgi:molybdopterin molybdotransferase